MPVAEKKTKHPYISIDPRIAGGQPVIRGTRIKVMDITLTNKTISKATCI